MANMNDINDTTLEFGEEDKPQKKKRIAHPVACFFHLFFRVSAIIIYLFCGLTNSGFVASFISILLMLCADFWTVKNISGRLLVGLRWWNKIEEDGKSQWIYESRRGAALKKHPVLAAESRIFWFGLILCPIFWFFMLFSTVFGMKPQWLAVVIIALGLNGANLFGYIRCKVGSRKQLGSMATSYIGKQIFQQATQSSEDTNQSSTN
uniref:Golgi apparatus membrane protein TVP23 homolog B-like n=1 Tax=Styela clava TaxID=7725 RepID=UPI001939E3F5|nr:Golgi apparatus membrane protein TVP23 homolog B-like [Styela clava]